MEICCWLEVETKDGGVRRKHLMDPAIYGLTPAEGCQWVKCIGTY